MDEIMMRILSRLAATALAFLRSVKRLALCWLWTQHGAC